MRVQERTDLRPVHSELFLERKNGDDKEKYRFSFQAHPSSYEGVWL